MSIASKYTSFAKAMQDMQALDIGLWQQLDADQRNWSGSYTASMRHDVSLVSQHGFPQQAAAIQSFWSDPEAWAYEVKLATGAANAVKGTVGGVSNAAGAVAQTGQGVANATFQGLASAFDMSSLISAVLNKNLWLRLGEGAIGILLLGIGVSIMAKSSSVGSATIRAGKTAGKLVK